MRIVKLKEFLEMPGQVVFSKYKPCVSDGLCIKGYNVGENDFTYASMDPVLLLDIDGDHIDGLYSMHDDSSIEANIDCHCYMRNGYTDANQMFMVMSTAEVKKIIAKLQSTLEAK